MRKLAVIGAALMIGGSLLGGAAPAQAATSECGNLTDPICEAVYRQVGHAREEAQHAYDAAYTYYTTLDATIRCVVFKQCA